MGCFMGIDAGTSGVKAIIMDGGGTVKGEGYAACEVQMPRVGWAEQNPVMWWNACTAAVKQAVRASGCGGEVRAVGLSGQMQGTVFLDKERRPIGNCIIWLDQRAAKEAKEVNRLFLPDNEILDITGSFCLPSHWAAKLLWFRRHCPGEFEKIDQVLFAKDYLRYRMTGEIATDVSDASLTSLLDLNKRSWSDKMFRILGIPKELVPSVLLESSDVAGFLSRQTAKSWGLPAGIPVAGWYLAAAATRFRTGRQEGCTACATRRRRNTAFWDVRWGRADRSNGSGIVSFQKKRRSGSGKERMYTTIWPHWPGRRVRAARASFFSRT